MKIIDCFTFYNELDLLKYRLELLYDIVDYFILSEATHTHAGYMKELYYENNKALFEKYSNKIIHVVVDDFPYKQPNVDFSAEDQWKNENFQRNCILRGIQQLDLNNEDIVMVSDLDEIPDPILLRKVKDSTINIQTATLGQDFYYFNLNTKFKSIWYGTRLVRYEKYLEIGSCQKIRDSNFQHIEHAGWHLSYFGDKQHIENKLRNFAHQELIQYANESHIEKCIQESKDLFNRSESPDYILISDNTYLPPRYDKHLTKFYKLKIMYNITFHYRDETIPYINRLIDEFNIYGHQTDLVIHTNRNMDMSAILHTNTSGKIISLYHDMTDQDRWTLTHKHRHIMETCKNVYDVFINAEDDILLPKKTLEYWLEYKKKVMNYNYNLGFVRIEFDKIGVERLPDLGVRKDDVEIHAYLSDTIFIDSDLYIKNNKNPYCAFWIYDKFEFNRFVNSKYYDIGNIRGYGITEGAASGLHGAETDWYRGTIIPLSDNNMLYEDCKIYHQTNKFCNLEDSHWECIEFNKIVRR